MTATPIQQPPSRGVPGQPLERAELFPLLNNAVSMCANEDQIIWSVFGTFWAANAILLVALFSAGKLPESPFIGSVVAAVGAVMSLIWHLVQRRALGHLARFEDVVHRLEEQLGISPQLALSATINVDARDRFLRPPRARPLMQGCSFVSALSWFVFFLYFVVCRHAA
ncbi:MAG: hypothetical protein ABSA70_13630 [Terriglobia bacterium]